MEAKEAEVVETRQKREDKRAKAKEDAGKWQ